MSDLEAKNEEIKTLRAALEASVQLQSHYAVLLNTYDGGHRIGFESADAWMERLRKVKASIPEWAKKQP